ncbi:divergent polysaccharide deacetylase family protein [Pseudodesulfovibrio sp.]|uniref:divergent polysaccharide deacetylase family protein n=1 Tax=Pseudodesulfovibrio sp. TaxID=2035812 RepID=UPI0026267066|nr:divergent polysaccharide deacetylase family protein [Pseudodesulfovibrio sp.]MDD3312030.1 divergent polysaccharide deacetylase family protein [Pseudodesulfovibrio sp.]
MDERPDEKKETAGSGSFLAKLYRPGPLVFLFAVAIGGLLWFGYHLATEETPPPEVVTRPEPVPAAPKIYEEETSTIEDKVKEVDLAIIEAMRRLGLNLADLELLDVELRHKDGQGYHYQVLRIPETRDAAAFLTALKERLAEREPEALLSDNGTAEAAVSVGALPTHRLLLRTVPFVLPRPEKKGPQLAVVIDDIGENTTVLEGLVRLDFPVTLAVWPNASHTDESVALAKSSGHDLIVHFPMEPQGYPKYNPGDDALFITMTDAQVRARVAQNLARVPGAIGVNNHMGSRFTENGPGMRAALDEFRQRGLFFLDSLTTPHSVGRKVARELGVPFYERDIFLDNVKDVNAIILQLKKAENVARKQGRAIAIGHPYPATLAGLREWAASRNTAVRLVPLSQMKPE